VLASEQFNLGKARALVVDGNPQALDILCGVLTAFGLREIVRKMDGKQAQAELLAHSFDLILVDGQTPQMDGYDLIRWLRHDAAETIRMTPAIVVTAHTPRAKVVLARDCGANFVIAKPISPSVVLERILWVARSDRMFVECDVFIGPDRRWKHAGPPIENPDGRRRNDKPAEIGLPEGGNLSQSELDELITPQKMAG